MTTTRRLRITIQTERLLVTGHSRSLHSLCVSCGNEARMLTVEQAASLTRVNARQIYHEVEAGELHFIETIEGSLLICFNSLFREEYMKSRSANNVIST
jgi:hypothetical protein